MHAGKLRHRVQVELVRGAQDAYGELVDSETDVVGELWAEVIPLTGSELVEARQVVAEITHRVTLRYGAEITPEHRIIHRDRTLEVLSVIDTDERNRELVVACRERA